LASVQSIYKDSQVAFGFRDRNKNGRRKRDKNRPETDSALAIIGLLHDALEEFYVD